MADSKAILRDKAKQPEPSVPEIVAAREEAMEEAIEEVVETESLDPDSPVSEYKRVYHVTIGVVVALAVAAVIFFVWISLP